MSSRLRSGSNRASGRPRPPSCGLFSILAILLLTVQGHAQEHPFETPLPFTIADPKAATAVVASVGPATITAQQFLINYELGPAFAKRHKDSRKDYLGYMVNEALLALNGEAHGLLDSERVRASLAEMEGDLATEELYKDDVLGNVRVPGKVLRRAMREEQMHRTVHWMYAPTREEIENARRRLRDGVPFDTLFAHQLNDTVKADDRSAATTLFELRLKTPQIAAVVDTLKPHEPSAPLRGPDGWYIVCVVDGWTDALTTEAGAMKLREDARRAIVQQKADSLSDRYVRRTMLDSDPVIVRTTFDLLRAWLGKTWLSPDRIVAWGLLQNPAEGWDSTDVAGIDRHAGDTLVTLKNDAVKLKEVIAWYRHREDVIRLAVSSPEEFFVSVEQMVWHMVRDRLLVRRAFERGLQKRDAVRTQMRWWRQKIVYAEAKMLIADSIALDDSTLRAYYAAHERDFKDAKGVLRPFTDTRDDVRNEVYTAEMTARLLHRINALKRIYPVVIHDDALQRVVVDTENNPKAIDTYVVKKGGVFPHPAFPTIDMDWQSWE